MTKDKIALTVQLPALRFCKAPAAASRVLKFWLSVRMERYSRTTSGWYSNSKPAGGEEDNGSKKRKVEKACMNKHRTYLYLITSESSREKAVLWKERFLPYSEYFIHSCEHNAHGNSPTGHSAWLKVPLIAGKLIILSEICAMLCNCPAGWVHVVHIVTRWHETMTEQFLFCICRL